MKSKRTFYWVTYSDKKGYQIVTRRPRKNVREPHESRESAMNEIVLDIYARVDFEEKQNNTKS